MSAPPGPPGGSGNGAAKPPPPVFFRAKPKASANPMVARKRTAMRPAISKIRKPEDPKQKLRREQAALEASFKPALDKLMAQKAANNGWSEKAPPNCQEFPLVTTKKQLLEGLRYHIMRLNKARGTQDKTDARLDVTDQDQFPRPVTLHRRDPRQPPAHKLAQLKEEFNSADPADEAEAERLRQQKADREAQRALDQAQIAPGVSRGAEPKQNKNKKEKVTTFYAKNTDEQKKQSGLRYEETLPWHLEDAEGKAGVWVASYVAGLSDLNCALVIDGNRFRMIPLERFYRFDEKPKFNTFTLDDAETMMKAKKVVKRWVMHDMEKSEMDKEREETRQFLRGRPRVKTESYTSRAAPKAERQDDFELDMSGDEFQDDDETPGFEADDEDTKDARKRMRREALGANLFGEGEESKVDEEEREAQLEKLQRKLMGKKTMKDLMKLEHAMDYHDSDSDKDRENPFTDSSDSDSEEEKKDEVKKEDDQKKADGKEASGSGAATKGTNTPSGKHKAVAGTKKGALKRPGSPNLSESSGNESSRKKVKIAKSGVASRSGTPLPGRPKGIGGATSDGEATAGEASDGGVKLKKKIKLKSGTGATGTPSGSRAGSPAPPATQGISPTKGGTSTPSGSPPPQGPPQAQAQPRSRIEASEIIQTISAHPNGISLSDLYRKFLSRLDLPGMMTKGEWIQLVKANSTYSTADRLVRPKTT
ncbi:hypothetical protein QBC34DRAFT_61995 [Podospora aff. communis PSN243]|uniref:Transcription initiation factor IIF subunit alpha n=1 Tax=Podospora aff. communis PSN243 TaxID=3040156 RepID=A0AAV9GQK6_9PEZI|nr:hypothetical protein QBC34DRAFT_61995 [Podospora aff. communis PSN243]